MIEKDAEVRSLKAEREATRAEHEQAIAAVRAECAQQVDALRQGYVTERSAWEAQVAQLSAKIVSLESVLGGTEAGQALIKQRKRAEVLARKQAAEAELAALDRTPAKV